MDVLVLNAAYQPIGVIAWRDAFTKMYADKADDRVEIVSTYQDRFINSAHYAHPMPSVVRHVKFTRRKSKGVKFSRDNVWARDKGRCQYCGQQVSREKYQYEHVMPASRGGKTDWENIVVGCGPCNQRKANRTPAEAKMKLLTVPKRPTSLPEGFKRGIRFKKGMPEEWRAWFGPDQYWHGGIEESPE